MILKNEHEVAYPTESVHSLETCWDSIFDSCITHGPHIKNAFSMSDSTMGEKDTTDVIDGVVENVHTYCYLVYVFFTELSLIIYELTYDKKKSFYWSFVIYFFLNFIILQLSRKCRTRWNFEFWSYYPANSTKWNTYNSKILVS